MEKKISPIEKFKPLWEGGKGVERYNIKIGFKIRNFCVSELNNLRKKNPNEFGLQETDELEKMIKELIQDKKTISQADQICDLEEYQQFLSDFFQKIDYEDRHDTVTMKTCQKFRLMAYFIDVLTSWDPLDDEMIKCKKYCKYKAVDIYKSLKKGEVPKRGGSLEQDNKPQSNETESEELSNNINNPYIDNDNPYINNNNPYTNNNNPYIDNNTNPFIDNNNPFIENNNNPLIDNIKNPFTNIKNPFTDNNNLYGEQSQNYNQNQDGNVNKPNQDIEFQNQKEENMKLKAEIDNLKKENMNLKKENFELKKEISSLKNDSNVKSKKLNDNDNEISFLKSALNKKNSDINNLNEQINSLRLNYDFNNQQVRRSDILTIQFKSVDQKVDIAFSCQSADTFVRIEEMLYNQYPELKEYNTYFTVNGNAIKRFKTIQENKIKNFDKILLNIFD